jgi:hypothetical protein
MMWGIVGVTPNQCLVCSGAKEGNRRPNEYAGFRRFGVELA